MKNIITSFFFVFTSLAGLAQYVNLPDANFRDKLKVYYPGCFKEDSLNINCAAKQKGILDVSLSSITTLEGIEYFDSLSILDCRWNALSELPKLPGSLQELSCGSNNLSGLPVLPKSLVKLSCNNNKIISLPVLPDALREIECYINDLTSLPALPKSLRYLYCSQNKLTSLPLLPDTLLLLGTDGNMLRSLPDLPNSLLRLHFGFNINITEVPELPDSLQILALSYTNVTHLDYLPASLKQLYCEGTKITCLPKLPDSLMILLTHVACLPNKPKNIDSNLDLCNTSNGCPVPSAINDSKAESSQFHIYPNPSNSGLFHIDGLGPETIVKLRNISGEEIYSGYSDNILDLSHESKGIYFAQFLSPGKSKSLKLIIY